MIPASFAVLDELPLAPSGKVNRRALADSAHAQPAASSGHVEPRTETERLLAGIWTDVLGLSPVGVDDNFFELGGHSLLATRVVSRIREQLELELPVRALFESPTIAELASTITQAAGDRRFAPDQPIPRLDRTPDGAPLDLDRLSDADVDALLARGLGLADPEAVE